MGATYRVKNKLSKQEQEELFIKLAKGISTLQRPEEVAQFLKDLLSEAEVFMLARRLYIAELLMDQLTYSEIRDRLKVSFSTIARVQTWLELYGEGYRTVVKRLPKEEATKQNPKGPFYMVKRKYPIYFWPEIILEEIVKSANKREKHRLRRVVAELKDKTKLSKELINLLK